MLLKLSVLLLWNQVARKFKRASVYITEIHQDKGNLWRRVISMKGGGRGRLGDKQWKEDSPQL